MADYIRKIKDLLALAESPNEHEARSALLKARELMAKHKISDKALEDKDNQNVERHMTGIDYSLRRDPWISDLASIIARHHCCRNFNTREKGRQTMEVGFIGLTNDITVCAEVFKYAVDCVRSITNKYRKTKGVRTADGYGYGFAYGLNEVYDMQQNEEGWGLVLTVPEAVNEAVKGMATKKMPIKKLTESNVQAFHKGVQDGREFDMEKRLSAIK